jgi:hypothetical protein
MEEFESWRSYSNFENAVKHQSRYIHPSDVEVFLQTVLKTAQRRVQVLPKDRFLWRAQLGHDWTYEGEEVGEVPAPHPPERMCPRPGRAKEGRANPRGIPYLYMASNKETAMAEVRPWIGSHVSVSQFKTMKDLKIMNCTSDRSNFIYYFKEPPPKEREQAVWADIDRAFSRPVTPSDDVDDYVPTQIIAELFKTKGFDGIGYRSSLGKGYNVVLFDISAAELMNGFLFELSGIEFNFEQRVNPYFSTAHYGKTKKEDSLTPG